MIWEAVVQIGLTQLLPLVRDVISCRLGAGLVMACHLLAIVLSWWYIPETSQRSLQAIEAILSGWQPATPRRSTSSHVRLEYGSNSISFDEASDDESKDDTSEVDDDAADGPSGLMSNKVLNPISTTKSTYRNWIGPALLDAAVGTSCYRKTHIAKTCPLGYKSKFGVCWTQCPLTHPVACGMECIKQNGDCALEVITKVAVVAQAALSVASNNVYGRFKSMAKGIQIAYKCNKEIMGLVKALSNYVHSVKVEDPKTSQEQLLKMLYQTDKVVFDIPVTIKSCLGIKVDDRFKFSDRVVNTVELILKEIITKGDTIIADWSAFTTFMKKISFGFTIDELTENEITSLNTALKSKSTCGYNMKRLLDRTWMTVAEMRRQSPSISEDDIRVAMSKSNLALKEIPIVTNNCMAELIAESGESEAYVIRDTLRKGIGGIMDDLIKSGTSNNGTLLTAEEYAFAIADKIATFYAVWEKKNIGSMMAEYFQKICGPTEFVGEIDDGSAKEALGMKTVKAAFQNSTGYWTRIGDGSISITFQSTDTKDVRVNIKSGGVKVGEVTVGSGKTVTWKSDLAMFEGKTLYLDRWRPNFLGLPGSGGGSLLLWVPRSTERGALQLDVKLNKSSG
ncbi:hypothetical protein PsorP6_003358 [Peronosclerospora sorghi]|uniref:Uncharacterized protein n=1 Tax=Peronosclerospora sorghi TaxID=230839 RepID=A0ACC0VKX5_9STRA|nr:hypothetical protein PsorP6_003358 [Peronosclerospora sorghi]